MANVAVTTTFVSGTTILASAVNTDLSDITTWLNNRNTAVTSWDGGSFAAAISITPTSNQIVLGTTRTVTINAGTPASSSRIWTIPDISAAGTFAALEGTQTFSGDKTLSGAVSVTGTSGITISNTGGAKLSGTITDSANSQAIYFGYNSAAATNIFELAINRNVVTGTQIQTGQSAASIKLNSADSDASISFATASSNNTTPTVAMTINKDQTVTIPVTSNQLILGTTRTVTINAGTPASSSRIWTIPDISAAGTFAALEGTQTFSGAKTFTSASGIVLSQAGGVKLLTTFLDSSNSQAIYSGFNTAATTNVFELAINRSPVTGTHIQTGQAASSIKLSSASSDASITFATSATNNGSPTNALIIDKNQNAQHADGLVGTPSVTFQNDTDCGMWRVGANDIAWSTNGVKAIELTTTDFSCPAVNLDMVGNIIKRVARGSVSAPGFYFNNDTGTGLYWPTTNEFAITNNGTKSFRATATASVVIGPGAALVTTATDGFLYIPTCAGTPTGVPTANTGTVALIYDTTNNKFYVYNGAWKGGTAPGAWS